jgi:cysteinyl-tRNA synthetase
MAGAIGALNIAIGLMSIDSPPSGGTGSLTYQSELDALHRMNSVLGVLDLEVRGVAADDENANAIDTLIVARRAARESKDWGRADEIRDELLAMGIAIKDVGGETTWERIVQ